MNKLKGHINRVEVNGNLSLVSVDINTHTIFKSIVIETPETAPYLKMGNPIYLLFKETEVILAVNYQNNLSVDNQISATIKSIEQGQLLSKVILETKAGPLTAIINVQAIEKLNLIVGKELSALVKMNEIMLSES